MTNDDARALRAVLESDADQNVPAAARQAVERDLAAIRRGLAMIALDAPAVSKGRPRTPRRALVASAVAAAIIAVIAIVAAATTSTGTPATDNDGASIGVPAIPLTLRERVAAASRIVVGTVTAVDRGRIDAQIEGESGDPYVLATVHIDEAIKGQAGDVIVFSYDLGSAITSVGGTHGWTVGDRVLLFLVPDVDTISAAIRPPHMQVAEGEAGRYLMSGSELTGADFTVEDVRRAAR